MDIIQRKLILNQNTLKVKADDDTIVNVRKLRLELQSLQANFSKPVIAGYELIHVVPS